MNERIEPVFEKIIPAIESAGIKYWIFGGVAYAAMMGGCYRNNEDVDSFVLEPDFENTERILRKAGKENSWKIRKTFLGERPKIEVYFLKGKKWKERFSVVPAYEEDDCIKMIFEEGLRIYSNDLLKHERRSLNGFAFYSISNFFLKKLFIEYLDHRNPKYLDPKRYEKRKRDAERLLSCEKFLKYFPN